VLTLKTTSPDNNRTLTINERSHQIDDNDGRYRNEKNLLETVDGRQLRSLVISTVAISAIIACLITEHTITINEVAIETGAGTPADDDRRTIFCGTVILRKRSTDDSYDQYFVTEDGDLGTRTPSTRAFLRDVG
jgi:hypothetical protein